MGYIISLIQKLYSFLLARSIGSCGNGCVFITFSKFFKPENIFIGNNVFINQQCILVGEEKITIKDNVAIGFRCMILTSNNEVFLDQITNKRAHYDEPITIEKNVWLGAGSIILSGVTVGEGSVVAAGAVVTRDVPPHTLVGEVPARIIRHIDTNENYSTLKESLHVRVPYNHPGNPSFSQSQN
ncbi:MAG: Acetyltransferase [Candidatus Gottesmanbacteria bacterium GW2011_GWB1_44_11c]|uniref:Acetyltransferase n=2 Tax=Candidatus Gottesmaniibacteriota TaxID=1752720 RepID=A0A0G1KY68_9BACT|nr:MAG: Acetyltransferase [Candidatus Gottesmanbacteria bacterium GW2011_GWB1_44_11c]KKT61282.1 MAG: Acetyltransferase [Candidatus Gottesmanbacteria bacterium GW2011_GWA1_44_24b]